MCLFKQYPFFYCCLITVVPIFPITPPCPIHRTSHLQSSTLPAPGYLCPWVLYTCSWTTLPLFSPVIPLPSPWLLSVCSLFQCLWLYFACLFVLLIKFHLKVRSYGVCFLPPGLFHLPRYFLVPSMLLQRVGVLSFFLLRSSLLYKCTTVF